MKTFAGCFLIVAIFLPFLLAENQVNQCNNVKVINCWKNLEFAFDSEEQKNYTISKGYYSPSGQKRPYDTDVYVLPNGEWLKFLSIPRVGKNIPFTLATIDDNSRINNASLLRAYPDMSWHLERSCDKLFAVFRLWVDNKCKRLWVIDSGRDFTAGVKTQICKPKIVTFDLTTNEMIFKHEFPDDHYLPEVSIFNSITLLSPNQKCRDQFAYVTDARGPGLVVYDAEQQTSWRTQSPLYKADPNYYQTTIAGETFNFTDGLYTVAPYSRNNSMYFHAYATLNESVVRLSIINNKALWTSSQELSTEKYFKTIGTRPTQSLTEAVDSRGNLWFTLLNPLSIVCWNPANPYSKKYFRTVTVDAENLQFVAGLKIRMDKKLGEVLLGVSNRNQKHTTGTVSSEEINYRIFYLPIKKIDCSNIYK